MIALLTLLSTAHADPTVSGGSGLIMLPTTDTVMEGQAGVAVGTGLYRDTDGLVWTPIPAGLAVGLTDASEFGVHLERDAWLDSPAVTDPVSAVGVHGRYRILNPNPGQVGLGLHAAFESVTFDQAVEFLALGQVRIDDVDLHIVAGPRWGPARGGDFYVGAGAEVPWLDVALLQAEWAIGVGAGGVREASTRIGSRIPVTQDLGVLPWMGTGAYESLPWFALGFSLTLHSTDPRRADRDGDFIVDWTDACPHDPEDVDGHQDQDGCVDPDNDGDGIPDTEDDTPDGIPVYERPRFQDPTPKMRTKIKPREVPGPSRPEDRPSGTGDQTNGT